MYCRIPSYHNERQVGLINKNLFDLSINLDTIKKSKDRFKSALKGILGQIFDPFVTEIAIDKRPSCQLVKGGESEKAVKMVKEYNKYVDKQRELRKQLITVLNEAAQKNTKTTFPLLIW